MHLTVRPHTQFTVISDARSLLSLLIQNSSIVVGARTRRIGADAA